MWRHFSLFDISGISTGSFSSLNWCLFLLGVASGSGDPVVTVDLGSAHVDILMIVTVSCDRVLYQSVHIQADDMRAVRFILFLNVKLFVQHFMFERYFINKD